MFGADFEIFGSALSAVSAVKGFCTGLFKDLMFHLFLYRQALTGSVPTIGWRYNFMLLRVAATVRKAQRLEF